MWILLVRGWYAWYDLMTLAVRGRAFCHLDEQRCGVDYVY